MTAPHAPPPPRWYLGDGVYLEDTGHTLVLTTDTGVAVTNRIVLEPAVWRQLLRWIARREAPLEEDDAEGR